MVALSEIDPAHHEVLIRRRDSVVAATDSLFSDHPRFDEAVRIGTNTPARLRERITTMMRALNTIIYSRPN